MKRAFLLMCVIAVACAASFTAHSAVNCIGRVLDEQGQPIANTKDGILASGILAPDHARATVMQKGIQGVGFSTASRLGVGYIAYSVRLRIDF